MATIWALVANTSRAYIFKITGKGKHIDKIMEFDYPDGRKKTGEIHSDKPGRAFDRVGVGRHALSTEVDVRMHQHQVFARQLFEALKKAYGEKEFEQLAIIAPAQLLGELKRVIGSDPLEKTVIKHIDKDLSTSLKEQDIINHLCNYLDLWNR
jgi:protein required for attachment to host cells